MALDDHGRPLLDSAGALDRLSPDDKARVAAALSRAVAAQAAANEAKRELLRTLETVLPQGETIMGESWCPADKPVQFEGLGMCFYEAGPMRAPRRGEFYLSGAIVEAYRAPNDLGDVRRIVRPTHYAKQRMAWIEGDKVRMTAAGVPLPRLPQG